MCEKLSCLLQNKNILLQEKELNITKIKTTSTTKNIYLLFLNKTVVMKGRKGQPSLQDLRDYYKRQQYLEHFEEELCLSRRKKKQLTASGLQREDERPQNEPDLRSVHYI